MISVATPKSWLGIESVKCVDNEKGWLSKSLMNKYSVHLLGLVAAASLFTAFSAVAHDENPDGNKWKQTTIRWVVQNENNLDKDYKFVALVGTISKKLDSDTYLFSDGTGTIELDSDIVLPVGKPIVVRGEIDQAYLHIGPLEINVDSWRPVSKPGQVLTK